MNPRIPIWTAAAGVLLAGALTLTAQGSGDGTTQTIRLAHPDQPATIHLSTVMGSITVKGYSGSQILVDGAGGATNRRVPEEARGMVRLNAPDVGVEEDNNVVTIHPGSTIGSVTLQVPASSNLRLHSTNGTIRVEGVFGDLDLQTTNGSITLEGVGGSLVASALNGKLSGSISRFDAEKPSSFSTMNGTIDLTLPANLRANLVLRSDQGSIYIDSGWDFKRSEGAAKGTTGEAAGMVNLRQQSIIRGTLGGGGVEIDLRSFNGNVLLHKGP